MVRRLSRAFDGEWMMREIAPEKIAGSTTGSRGVSDEDALLDAQLSVHELRTVSCKMGSVTISSDVFEDLPTQKSSWKGQICTCRGFSSLGRKTLD